ncbi:MAG: zinc-dependent alcohol dehydrogenase family protein [Acidimicrobiales bacterium]
MKAVVIDKPRFIAVREVPDPTPARGGLVVRVEVCGVCGTDLHIADGEFPPTPYPIIPGHEFAGEVVAVGPDTVLGPAVGDRVAVDPSLFCGSCGYCRAGRGNLCENWGAIGDTVDGAFAEYVAAPAANAYRLPDHVDFAQGAMIEPLSCAVHGLHQLGSVLGSSVLLVGAGTMGLLLQQLLLHAGASGVTVLDKVAGRLEVARKLGASTVAASVGELDGERFDVAVDATGVPAVIEEAFGAIRRGGRLLIFGVAPTEAAVALSPFRIYNDEITVVGSMAVLNSFGTATELMASGVVDAGALLGQPFALSSFTDALDQVRSGEGIKIQVTPNC